MFRAQQGQTSQEAARITAASLTIGMQGMPTLEVQLTYRQSDQVSWQATLGPLAAPASLSPPSGTAGVIMLLLQQLLLEQRQLRPSPISQQLLQAVDAIIAEAGCGEATASSIGSHEPQDSSSHQRAVQSVPQHHMLQETPPRPLPVPPPLAPPPPQQRQQQQMCFNGNTHHLTRAEEELQLQAHVFNQQRWLLLLRHCAKCQKSEAECEFGNACATGKQLWVHVLQCGSPQCSYPRCVSSKTLLKHFHKCQAPTCLVCVPVHDALRRASGVAGRQPPPHP